MRVYAESVKKWAKKIGIVTVPTIIFLYVMYSIALGGITVTDYRWSHKCAGQDLNGDGDIDDYINGTYEACWFELDIHANQDIFWYPVNYDPYGRNIPFDFTPEINGWHLYRKWGKGWREINMTRPCKYTWCGAPKNNAKTKYAFAFRKGRNYTIKLVAGKKSIVDTIKVHFNPTIYWHGVNITYELLDNTDYCFSDCSLKFRFKIDSNYTINNIDKFTSIFNKVGKNSGLQYWEFRIGKNVTKNITYISKWKNCSTWGPIGFDNKTNTTQYGIINYTCPEYKQKTIHEMTYTKFNPLGKTIEADKWYYIELYGKKKIVLGDNNIDAIPVLGGFKFPFAWWNSSYSKRKPININVSDGNTLTDFQVLINVTYESDMQSDFDDLRFTNNCSDDAYEIPYWIKNKTDSQYANVWIKVPIINSTICMYYGNSEVTNKSNGTAVFEFFDDFEDGDISDWIVSSGNGVNEASTTQKYEGTYSHHIDAGSSDLIVQKTTPYTIQAPIVIELWVYDDVAYNRHRFFSDNEDAIQLLHRRDDASRYKPELGYNDNLYTGLGNSNFDLNKWHKLRFKLLENGDVYFEWWYEGTTYQGEYGPYSGQVTNISKISFDAVNNHAGSGYQDLVKIGKYHDPEPTYEFGSEETSEDTTPPSITIYSPENTTYNTQTINLEVSANEAIDTWWYSLNGGSNVTFVPNTTITGIEGLNNIIVYANDTSGNVGQSQVYFTIDTTPPSITITSPKNQTYNSLPINLNVTTNESADWCGYNLDGNSNITLNNDSETNWFIEMNPIEGLHHLYVYCNDTMGNMGENSTIWFTYNSSQTLFLYLNGIQSDRNYEINSIANITCEYNDHCCLSINASGYGDNFTCFYDASGYSEYDFLTFANQYRFLDGNEFNIVNSNSTIYLHVPYRSEIINASFDVYANSLTHNVTIDIGHDNNIDVVLTGDLVGSNGYVTNISNLTYTTPGMKVVYLEVPNDVDITNITIKLNGKYYDNITYTNEKYSVADSVNGIYVQGLSLYGSLFDVVLINNTCGSPYCYETFDRRFGEWYIKHDYDIGTTYNYGICRCDDDYIYMTNDDTNQLEKYYYSNMSYITSYSLHADNTNPKGCDCNGTYIYIADSSDTFVYQYEMDGTYVTRYNISGNGVYIGPRGISIDDKYAYITYSITGGWAYIYKYYLSNLTYTGTWYKAYALLDNTYYNARYTECNDDYLYVLSIDNPEYYGPSDIYKFYKASYPKNVKISSGYFGFEDYYNSGELQGIHYAYGNITNANLYIQNCNDTICNLPIYITSTSLGKLDVEVNLTYSLSKIHLNKSAIDYYLNYNRTFVTDLNITGLDHTNNTYYSDIDVYQDEIHVVSMSDYYDHITYWKNNIGTTIASGSTYSMDSARIAVNETGNPRVVYFKESGTTGYYYRYYDGSSWSSEQLIYATSGNGDLYPFTARTSRDIIVDDNDNVYLSGLDLDNLIYLYKDSSGWHEENVCNISESIRYYIGAVPYAVTDIYKNEDTIYITYPDIRNATIYLFTKEGTSWNKEVVYNCTSLNYNAMATDIEIDDSGRIYVTAVCGNKIYLVWNDSGSWISKYIGEAFATDWPGYSALDYIESVDMDIANDNSVYIFYSYGNVKYDSEMGYHDEYTDATYSYNPSIVISNMTLYVSMGGDYPYNTYMEIVAHKILSNDIPMHIQAYNWGEINLTNLSINYNGPITYEVTATSNTLSTSYSMNIYWSNYSRKLPYDWTNTIFFYATNDTEYNVTPYAQSNMQGIYNITSYAYYKPFSLYLYNASLDSCITIYASNTSNRDDAIELSAFILNNMNYLSENMIWLWADLNNCNDTIYEFDLKMKSCCEDCVCEV